MIGLRAVYAKRGAWFACAALAMLWLASVHTPAHAWQRSDRVLASASTRLEPVVTAPDTALSDATRSGTLRPSAPATSLMPQRGPETMLRAGEVPPARMEQTRVLLQELQAVQTPQQAIAINLPADVLFDFDRAELRPDAEQPIARAAELVQSYPRAPLAVVGHTDSKGSDEYNQALSLRRAQTVAQALQAITGRTPSASGLGETEPVAPNTAAGGADNPAGRQLNRRVQILINPIANP